MKDKSQTRFQPPTMDNLAECAQRSVVHAHNKETKKILDGSELPVAPKSLNVVADAGAVADIRENGTMSKYHPYCRSGRRGMKR